MNWKSTYKPVLGTRFVLTLFLAAVFVLVHYASLTAQVYKHGSTKDRLPLEKLVYPQTSLCILNIRGEQADYPFDIEVFNRDLWAYLRSADYLTVKTEKDIEEVLLRDRIVIPETYEPRILSRICKLTDSDYLAYMRMIQYEMDLHDGFTIPVFFHKNKVTYRAELDLAVIEGRTGSLQYSAKVVGRKGLGRGIQVYPITEDPALHLNFREKEALARETMMDLARRSFESLMQGMQKNLKDKYICYWQDEVHIIADKPGLCPICGSRLVKIRR